MPEPSPAERLSEIALAAVRAHGSDWSKVAAAIEESLRAFPPEDRAILDAMIRSAAERPLPSGETPAH